jgi:hypothetical protein
MLWCRRPTVVPAPRNIVFVLAMVCVGATACADNPLASNANPIGEWRLDTFNRLSLPVTAYDDGVSRIVIDSISLSIRNDGIWSDQEYDRTIELGTTTKLHYSDGGSYTVKGSTMSLVSEEGGSDMVANVGKSSLTIHVNDANDPNTYVFVRR